MWDGFGVLAELDLPWLWRDHLLVEAAFTGLNRFEFLVHLSLADLAAFLPGLIPYVDIVEA